VRTQAIVALVLSGVSLLFCCALPCVASIVTSSLALGRVDTDLPAARRLVAWSWGILAGGVVLGILIVVGLVAFSANQSTTGG
jgi:hypothetical protein